MSDAPSSGDERNYSAYADIARVEQDDGPCPVAPIRYAPDYKILMDIFRGVLHKGEYSERGLDLTQEIIEYNAASYTVWQYRRDCLRRISDPPYNLDQEIFFLDTFAGENPKNYQIWHHRRAVVDMIAERASGNSSSCSSGGMSGPDVRRELLFTESVFNDDPKNYHAWAHRQYVVSTFGGFEGELAFVQQLLDTDIRNNSAWNHRWFVLHRIAGGGGIAWNSNPVPVGTLAGEVDYAFAAIAKAPNNESAWNYLRGLHHYHPTETKGSIEARLLSMHEQVRAQEPQGNSRLGECVHFLAFVAEVLEKTGALQGARQLLLSLCALDTVRMKVYERDLHRIAGALRIDEGV